MFILSILFYISCVTSEITKVAGEFPDNPTHDYDGDGLTEQTGDCDDLNHEVLGPSLWYADVDADGFGDAGQGVEACLSALLNLDDSTSYVANSDDCDDSDSETYPGSSREGGLLCVRDSDGDGYGDSTASNPFDAGTDCNDSDASIFPNNARYEDDELCVLDADGDGYGDALPSVLADPGSDCNDSDEFVYPGYNNELGNLCILDEDGDGYGQINPPQPYDSGSDCDDSLNTVHPGAVESCNGLDSDCNGIIDDDTSINAPNWYYDGDQDGFGSSAISQHACTAPLGFVSDFTDCNDNDSQAYPNAPEYCNGQDDNCNLVIDEISSVDVQVWYADSDGDSYGDPNTITLNCNQPSGYVGNADDCNDFSSVQYPGAPEQCNGSDDSCDGQVDEGVELTFFIDGDGDGFGNALQTVLACSLQPGTVSNSSDCDDTDPSINPNAPEYCNFKDDNCDGLSDNGAVVDPTVFYLDSDGDGRGDPNQTLQSCPIFDEVLTAPVGYSFYGDDCDDSNADRSPLLPELCTDVIDENCDGDPILGAVDLTEYFADGDGDGQGNALFSILVCSQPFGYVTNSDDCNDTDSEVLSGMPLEWEICNGKLDRCEDDDGLLSLFADEIDDDGDGYVDCALDVDPLQWEDPSVTILGGGDCNDSDDESYPGAPEKCNGAVESYSGDGLCVDIVPSDEFDDDGDGYVECSGFDAALWLGDPNVVGGEDCNDIYPNAAFTFPGSTGDPNVCAQDVDGDGLSDCVFQPSNIIQVPRDEYYCDMGIFLTDHVGPDFVRIPAGDDPLGRYSISFDFYMMTTEVTVAMWEELLGIGGSSQSIPKDFVSYHDAALYANELSTLEGVEQCYSCTGIYPNQSCIEQVSPTSCEGFRLPTEWEWVYAARSESTSEIWTGEGPELGGYNNDTQCSTFAQIYDSVNDPLMSDFMWFCGNNDPNGVKVVGQKRPNGFGLYDILGNLAEWTTDWLGPRFPAGLDPYSPTPGVYRIVKGSHYNSLPSSMKMSLYAVAYPTTRINSIGFRLVKRASN